MGWSMGSGTANTGGSGWNVASIADYGGIGVGVAGMINQGSMNRKSRKFANEQTEKQRYWALEDWNRNNLYNSPAEQMKRLKVAGLNPNLIYDNGAGAMTSAPVRASDSQSWKSDKVDTAPTQNAIMGYVDLQRQQANTDLLKKQIDIADADIKLKGAQTFKTLTDVDRTKIGIDTDKFDLAKKNSLLPFDLQYSEASVWKKLADVQFTNDQNARNWANNEAAVRKIEQEIINAQSHNILTQEQTKVVKQSLYNLKIDGNIKKMTEELNRVGLTWSDEAWQRLAIDLSKKFGAKY